MIDDPQRVETDRARRRGPGFWTALTAAAVVGALLRVWHLDRQTLGIDELHMVRAALDFSWREILTRFHPADNCIPISALNHGFVVLGVPLTERLMRFPMLAAGVIAPPLLGFIAARRLDSATGAYFAWLLALCPQLVFYSVIARPYMPVVLLTAIGAFACEGLARRTRLMPAAVYGACGAISVWLHPLTAAIAVMPPIAALPATRDLDGASRTAAFRRLFAGAAICAGLGALLIGPAVPSLFEWRLRHGPQMVTAGTWFETAALAVGTGSMTFAALVWIGVLIGFACLVRRDRHFALFTFALVASQVIAIRTLSPVGITNPPVLGRYLMPAVPFLALWLAVGLAALRRASPARLRPLVAVAPVVVFLLGGPLTSARVARSSFFQHDYVMRHTDPLPDVEPSPCYRKLADLPDGAVFDAPWFTVRAGRVPAAAQRAHGRAVRLGVLDGRADDARVAWRTLFSPEPEGALASGAAAAVLHVDPVAEDARIQWHVDPRPSPLPEEYVRSLADLGALHERYRQVLGTPVCADGAIVVWDLTRVHPAAP